MSDLLNSASLVMIPSGYKEDVVYSEIPTDGSGDLSFTRASNGTRINSAGLVEVCPWNLLQYSEDFSAGWTLIGGGSFTSNAATAPNGTNTADEYDQGGYVRQYLTMPLNNVTFTFYVRAKTSSTSFRIGILGSGDSAIAETIKTVSTSWAQMSVTYNNFGGSAIGVFFNIQSGDSEVYIWGAQLNIGSTAKPYFPTTDRLNVPRLTYQNGGGGCPSLLLEKQSTNLVTYSEDFTQTPWTKGDVTIISNNTISPDGTQNADKFILDATNSGHIIYQSIPNQNSGYYTVSCYVKYGNVRYFSTRSQTGGVVSATQFYDLQNGVVVGGSSDANITSVGNGWYQITLKCLSSNSTDVQYIVHCFTTSSTSETCTSDGSLYGYIWGAQAEASSYPTSYIPTTSASATRVADACYKTGISSLIGQSEGTIFVDFNRNYQTSSYDRYFAVDDGDASIYRTGIFIIPEPSVDGRVYIEIRSNNVGVFGFTYNSTSVSKLKIAVAYKNNDMAIYINGTQSATSSASLTFAHTLSKILSNGNGQSINESVLFPTRLTNAELASLTTI